MHSDMPTAIQTVNACGDDSKSLALDLSTTRPDWAPRERDYEDYAAWSESLTPTFNSKSSGANLPCGDERRFILVREANVHDRFSRVVTVKQGHTYEVYIYFRNGDTVNNVSATSHGTRLVLSRPELLYEPEKITASIQSDNALPISIVASVVVQPEIGVHSTYLEVKSAKVYNYSNELLYEIPKAELKSQSESGVHIGCSRQDGEVVAGCGGHIIVQYEAKRISRFVGVSAGSSPGGPWKNTALVLESREPFWVRYRYVNTGQVVAENVSLEFYSGIRFPWNTYIDEKQRPYVEDSVTGRRDVDLDTLFRGVDLHAMKPGDWVNIFVPIAPGDGWQEKLCTNRRDELGIILRGANYVDSASVLYIYPQNGLCGN
jgi:hypothetical protein